MTNTRLYDNQACQAMLVLGTKTHTSEKFPTVQTVAFRYENATPDSDPEEVSVYQLLKGDRYSAVCRHIHGVGDTCPNCEADDADLLNLVREYGTEVTEHRAGGLADIPLGMIYQHADTTWSAVTPFDVVLGSGIASHDSAIRCLTLDTKMRAWSEAERIEEQARILDAKFDVPVTNPVARATEAMRELATGLRSDDPSTEDLDRLALLILADDPKVRRAVATLRMHGVRSGAEFERLVELRAQWDKESAFLREAEAKELQDFGYVKAGYKPVGDSLSTEFNPAGFRHAGLDMLHRIRSLKVRAWVADQRNNPLHTLECRESDVHTLCLRRGFPGMRMSCVVVAEREASRL